VRKFYSAHQALVKAYGHEDLKFTLDGRLVGDIGEALARELFGLVPTKGRVKGVDSQTPTSERDRELTHRFLASGTGNMITFHRE
jgi:hypothetical protein